LATLRHNGPTVELNPHRIHGWNFDHDPVLTRKGERLAPDNLAIHLGRAIDIDFDVDRTTRLKVNRPGQHDRFFG
jgi:hypothetical protein